MLRTDLIRPVPELLRANADRFGDKPACSDGHRTVSHAELERRTRRLAGHLAGLRLHPGDRAMICLGNRVETVESYFGVLRANGVAVPVNPRSTDAELSYLLADSGARLVLTDVAHADQFDRLREQFPELRVVVSGDGPLPKGFIAFEPLPDTEPDLAARDDLGLDEVAWMLYTSGTTGLPKGVLSTQRNCLWSLAACYVPVTGLTAEDRVLWPLPLFHSLSHIVCLLAATAVGAGTRIVDGVSTSDVLDALREERSTFIAGVPTLYHHLIEAARERDFATPELRIALVGGAVATADLVRSFEATFGVPLVDAYGSTETCGAIAVNWPTGPRVEGSCGLPVPGLTVRLVDPDTGVDVPAGREGEFWVSGPNIMAGYHNQPEATAAALRDGWYRTGDLGRRDEAGFCTVTGRIKELVIRAGENIHPGEVEAVLRTVPGVADAAVVGKPHAVLGEVPVAFVVPGPDGFDPSALLATCRERLSYFKVPEEIYEIARVPRTASGKITRHVLLELPARLRAAGDGQYDSLLRLDWVPQSALPDAPAGTGTWALVDADALGAGLAEGLRAAGVDVADPVADYVADVAGDDGAAPDVVVVAPQVVGLPEEAGVPDEAGATVGKGIDWLAARLGAWLADDRLAGTTFVVATTGAVATGSEENGPEPLSAALWGVVRSLQAVYPGRLTLVDVDGDGASDGGGAGAGAGDDGRVAALLRAVRDRHDQAAIRGGVLLVPRLTRISVPAEPGPAPALDPDGLVVITGGDTARGTALARHLVTAYGARNLLLLSANGLPEEAAVALRTELARDGAQVSMAVCDPADRAALDSVLDAQDRPVTAAVHIEEPGPERSLATSLRGMTHLEERTRTAEPALFVVVTSTAGVLGSPGRPDRAAADQFGEALVRRRRALGLGGLALAWGPLPGEQGTAPVAGAVPLPEALALFDAALTAGQGPLVLLRPSTTALAGGEPVPAVLRHLVDAPSGVPASDEPAAAELRRRLAAESESGRRRMALALVREHAAATLGLASADPVEADQAFSAFGFTSLTAVALRNRLNAATGARLAATAVFDHPTPAGLARHLVREITGKRSVRAPVRARGVSDEPVAIVAMGCHLPGEVATPEDLWRLVADGRDAIAGFPEDRGWDLAGLFDSDPDAVGKSYVREGGFLTDAGGFDAAFFGISPREALAMDPQQRLLLETAWETFENAGIDPGSLHGTDVGVFSGVMYHDYGADAGTAAEGLEGHLGVGSAGSVVSGRVAYAMGLTGPAVTVDTACSSSLVALHLAVQAVRTGECSLALAGGVAVMSRPTSFIEFSRQRGLAPDGRCKSFAEGADGTNWSEGVGLVLLERLSDARRNGHEVLAVVRGTAVNQDGASNGLTAPNGPSQERVIRQALANAGLTVADVDAVEAHGTGTSLGDPIEAQALLATYGQERPEGQPLWLGSLKSNIGHAQAAAGVAGVIKMVLAMRHNTLPKTLHAERPTTQVDWASGAVSLLSEARPWPETGHLRRAGISSFGVSGTNAHVVLEQAPPEVAVPEAEAGDAGAPGLVATGGVVPWLLSGKTAAGLRAQAERLVSHLESGDAPRAVDVGWSLATTRAALDHRAVILAKDTEDGIATARALAEGQPDPLLVTGQTGTDGKTVFVFPGQGAQWVGMGAQLLNTSPVFAVRLRECADALAPYTDWSLMDVITGAPNAPSLDRVDVVQPATFAVVVSLAALWQSMGIHPDAVIGHSQGEIAAACVAGHLTLDTAAKVVALRSQIIADHLAGHGGMMSLAAPADTIDLTNWHGKLWIAAHNGPSATVIAGDAEALHQLHAHYTDQSIRARIIPVDYASHTGHVDTIKDQLHHALDDVTFEPGIIPWLSTVTGQWIEPNTVDGGYWYRNLRQTVQFDTAITTLADDSYRTFIEVSPHPVLTTAIQETLETHNTPNAIVTGTLRRDDDTPTRLLTNLAELSTHGTPVDWPTLFTGSHPTRITLPTYAFQHHHYWLPRNASTGDVSAVGLQGTGHPLAGAVVSVPDTGGVLLTGQLSVATHPWLADHAVSGTVLLPGAAMAELAIRAGDETDTPTLEELVIGQPMTLPEDGALHVQVLVGGEEDGRRGVRIYSRPDAAQEQEWLEHASGTLATQPDDSAEGGREDGMAEWPPPGVEPIALDDFYDDLAQAGYEYGPAFRGLKAVWKRDGEVAEVFAEAALPEEQTEAAGRFGIHPALLDAALHASNFCVPPVPGQTLLPFVWNDVRLLAAGATAVRVRARATGPDSFTISLYDSTGSPVASVDSLVLRAISPEQLAAASGGADRSADALFTLDWTEHPTALGTEVSWTTLPDDHADVDAHVDALIAEEDRPGAVVADTAAWAAEDTDLPARARDLAARALDLVQRWLARPELADVRLVLLTRGAVSVHDTAEVTDPAAAAIWGLVRSAQSEHPGRIALVDTDDVSREALPEAVASGEPQVAVRRGLLWVPRLVRSSQGLAVPAHEHWYLDVSEKGSLENLALRPDPEATAPLATGQVRIEVRAAGQNFRDVLVALGGVAGQEGLGGEGAGVVTEVGPGVVGLAVGDRVMGLFPRSFGPLATADARTVAPIPEEWSYATAAGVPVAYLTALYGLRDLGNVQPGETVLVHAAAGGVGMAAVQLARHFGAAVYATAHPSKHHVLTALGVPEGHLASSRDLGFASAFPALDVVLNSLTGEYVDASLGLLGTGGRFVEMGKNDIRDPAVVSAAHPGVGYQAFDLGGDAGPDRIRELLAELVELFEAGRIEPLPIRHWDVTQAPTAFRWMSQGRHTGKIVLTLPRALDPDGTVLVTGGTGTLGATIARHLVTQHGARRLLLISRQGPDAPGATDLTTDLTELGAQVRITACDTADRTQLATTLADIPADHPLTAVIHTAGALDDGILTALTPDRLDTVFRPKVDAITHLHDLTRDHDLAAFVIYSSAAGTLGNAGQANYAAANAFLDAFAQWRHARHRPATSLAWGLWSDTSTLTATMDTTDVRRTRRAGVLGMDNAEALRVFDTGLRSGRPALVAAKIDLTALRAPDAELSPLLRGLARPARRTARTAAPAAGGLSGQLAGLSPAGQQEFLLSLVRAEAAVVLGHAGPEAIEPTVAFKEMGFDSLTAVELRNRLNAATGLRLPATLLFDHPTPALLTELFQTELGGSPAPTAAAPVTVRAAADEPIAVVAMSCRLPGGVTNPDGLWNLLLGERDGITDFPRDRGWDLEALFDADPDRSGTSYVLRGGFLEDAAGFDADFFGISPREALAMDPQQRLFLEACWEVFERAGMDPTTVGGGDIGVFAGVINQDYGVRSGPAPEDLEGYMLTGSATSVASGRVAYVLGLEGPAVTVDTACSSSLVAMHWAVQALRQGECSMALAGGATVMGRPSAFVEFSRQRGLAPDGLCKAFGAGADGTTFSEGVGVLLLERLSDARRNGHEVLAVVRGTAVNQDGASNGLTAPNGPSQQRVIRQALANAGLSATDIDAVEAHGTGTALGDPIEAQALLATYGQDRPGDEPVWLGSLKSNTGHTLAAAGVSSVIKMVLAMRNGTLPRSLYADEPTPEVDWSQGAVSLLTEARPWPETGHPRRAGISSFGISGTNAHLILEQAPQPEPQAETEPETEPEAAPKADDGMATPGLVATGGSVPWVLSAKTATALRAQAQRLLDHLESGVTDRPLDIGWSLATTRTLHDHRAVILTDTEGADATAALTALATEQPHPRLTTGHATTHGKTVFVFPGQGAQWAGMGAQLLDTSPVFATRLHECAEALAPYTDWNLIDVITGAPDAPSLERVDVLQPTTFAIMVSLAALWQANGIHPDAVIGHSQGEIAAACVAGHLTLTNAAKIVTLRSQTIAHHLTGHGAMMSVLAPHTWVQETLAPWDGHLWIAAINGPASVSVSGDPHALAEFGTTLSKAKVHRWQLPGVDFAGHSGHVDTIKDQLHDALDGITATPGDVAWMSTVDADWANPTHIDADYWYRNLRDTVRFEEGTRALLAQGYRVFIEVSTHPVLTTAIQDTTESLPDTPTTITGTLRRDDGGPDRVLTSLAELSTAGIPVHWPTAYAGTTPSQVPLPTYPFQHQHYWLAATSHHGDVGSVGLRDAAHPLLGAVVSVPDTGGVLLTGRLAPSAQSWLADHMLSGVALVPGTAIVELAVRAGDETGTPVLEELVLGQPMLLPEDGSLQVQVLVGAAEDDERRAVRVYSRGDESEPWVEHASGILSAQALVPVEAERQWPPAGAEPVALEGFYDRLAEAGYEYGPVFRGLTAAWTRDGDVFAEITLGEEQHDLARRFGIHPALLDAALHASNFCPGNEPGGGTYLPFSWNGVQLHADGATALRVRVTSTGPDNLSLYATDPHGVPVVTVGSLVLRETTAEQLRTTSASSTADSQFTVEWTEHALARDEVAWPALDAVHDQDTWPPVVVADTRAFTAEDGELPERARALTGRALAAIRRLISDDALADSRLVLLTRGGMAVHDDTEVTDPAAAAVWGLVRAAQAEHPGRVCVIDADDRSAEALPAALATEEPQLALRGGTAWVPRLVRARPGLAVPATAAWHLDVTEHGTLENLALVPHPRAEAPLEAGQVRIAVRAAGQNFRDVLIALGMYEAEIGTEGAGVVTEVGPGVADLAVGDRVMGMLPGSFGPLVVADRRTVVRMPRDWSFTAAAGVPVAYLTALYALRDLGDVQPGETVLVHAAAGGVGMAAVHLAHHFGATVLATAHPAKHHSLEQLGVATERRASSRDLTYAHTFPTADIVLNSLTGEHIDASLRLLNPGGRFIEMGRTDIRDVDEVAATHPDRTYRAFDLGADAGPDRIQELLVELVDLFEQGLIPPLPTRPWEITRAPDAFRWMSQGRHTGKIVLTLPRTPDPDGTVLITGGTGTLGTAIARHLVTHHGVRNLVLAGRQGPNAPGAADLHDELTALGAQVRITACDSADRDQLAALLADIPSDHPLTGIVHTAGTLADGTLTTLDPDRIDTVFRPKVDAVTHLHDLTRDQDLALFAVYSSAAGILGNAGQANYAAANTFLDAFVQQRRAAGLAGLSLAWGLWAETSELSAALITANRDRTRHGVVRPMTTEHALSLFDSALGLGLPLVVPAKLDPGAHESAAGAVSPLLTGLVRPTRRTLRSATGQSGEGGLAARLAALSEADQHRLLLDLVRDHTATVLGHTGKDAVDARRAFSDIGVDSLIAVELRNRLAGATGLRLPATVVFDYATPEAMAGHLRSVVAGDTAAPGSPSTSAVAPASAVAPVDDPVAIVSMNCRLPGKVTGPGELWDLVSQGRDAIGPFPTDRGWDVATLFDLDPDAVGKSYVREGGFLTGAGDFDAEFFGISPREALAMDPQQRLLAETSWELFEQAGIDPMSVRGQAIGVFAGVIDQGYIAHSEAPPPELEGYLMTGSTTSVASGRVAYLLGLEGPAVTVDTACSSSLVALHLAVQALRAGECSMAITGGVTVIAKPGGFISFSRQRGLAPDGRSKSFSEGADGTTFSEGIGLVLLERLSDARRNGHEVLAVIRGTAVNQDGASNGLTAPNGPSQQRVIRQALSNAGLTVADVDAVEAHGTGTALGDPIEAQALLATYGQDRSRDEPLWLGSLKSNLGHTQAAAGIAGLIKMVLAMRHGTLPRSLHASEPTTKVDWASGAVSLLSEARPWPETGHPRRAGISSFGISGTNAHVILEQAPEVAVPEAEASEAGAPGLVATGGVVPWVLSAKSPAALRAQAERLVSHLESGDAPRAVDVGWSLATTRAALDHRAVILATDTEQGTATVRALAEGRPDPLLVTGQTGTDGKTVFVFPGQGAQWVGMGAQLLNTSPVFAARLNECAHALAPYTDWSLMDVITGAPDAPSLDRVDVVQPATFAVVVSLAALWQSTGIHPDAVIGHSQGEIAAACVAGHLTLTNAAKIVALRSQIIADHLAGHGGMMSVLASREQVEDALTPWQGKLWIAAHNSPQAAVVAGDIDALHELHAHYTDQSIRARIIPVDYASHTGHVDTIKNELRQTLADTTTEPGTIPWLSTVTGQWIEPNTIDSDYWYRNLRQTVQFNTAITTLADDSYRTYIEVSPHPVLTTAIQETLEANDTSNTTITGTLRRDDDTPTRLLTNLAHLTTHGHTPDWTALYSATHPHPTPLPTYAFQHHHYWLTPSEVPEAVADGVFWEAVERGDLASLADSLGVKEETLEPVLPGLTSWRRRNQDQSTVDTWSYRIAWDPVASGEAPVLPGAWLVAVASPQAGDTAVTDVIAALAEHGADPVVVEVDTVEQAEVTALLRERMSGSDDEYAGVVSLLAWDERTSEPGTLSLGVAATVALMQAVEEIGLTAPLWCLTRGAVAVREPSEVTSEFQPLAWGMGVVQGLDQPSAWGGIVDLPQTPDETALARLCSVLAGMDAEDQVAVRAPGVFARRMRREPVTSAPAWQPRDTVLITGGTGGLGSYVARWAAGHGARHVVLLSRQGAQAAGAAELEAELTALGADVTIAACDVTDRDQLAAVLAEIPDDAPLSAVVHAAGLALPEKPLSKMTLAEFADIGRAKIAGARHLDDLLGERELDAFVLFSSGAAAWGSGGQSAYAAGNAYLDGLAQRRRARGLAATSVAWGAWGGGLGTIDEAMGAQWRRTGLMTMDPRLAALAMAHTVGSGTVHGVVADIDWERFAPGYTMARFRPLLRGLPDVIDLLTEDTHEDGAGQTELIARLAGLSPQDQERLLTELVQAEAAAVLGHASADATGDRPFSEIGFDSLTAVELRNRLNADTGLRLPATMVFDHPRPSALARRIRTELGQTDTSSVDSVLAELERLEAHLAALPKEKIERARITSRLQRMTTKVAEIEANGAGGETVTERLDTANADDVFAFIDQEFGVD